LEIQIELVEELEKLAVSLGMNAPGLEDTHPDRVLDRCTDAG
jgi:hypothetical protein